MVSDVTALLTARPPDIGMCGANYSSSRSPQFSTMIEYVVNLCDGNVTGGDGLRNMIMNN